MKKGILVVCFLFMSSLALTFAVTSKSNEKVNLVESEIESVMDENLELLRCYRWRCFDVPGYDAPICFYVEIPCGPVIY